PAQRAGGTEDGATGVVDIDVTRAVAALRRADKEEEIGRAIVVRVDRQADARRAGRRGAPGVVERQLRDVTRELAAQIRARVIDAGVVARPDGDRVVQHRAHAVRAERAGAPEDN